jgi:hypothetical protein
MKLLREVLQILCKFGTNNKKRRKDYEDCKRISINDAG